MNSNYVVTFSQITCCYERCGITFMVPDTWERKRREDHTGFYCPNGHVQYFLAKTEAEKLREQLAREKHQAEQTQARLRDEAEKARRQRDTADRRRAAMKGQVTKIKNRVGRGVCPCCNRTFQNLQRHMEGQHPDWAPEAEAEANASK